MIFFNSPKSYFSVDKKEENSNDNLNNNKIDTAQEKQQKEQQQEKKDLMEKEDFFSDKYDMDDMYDMDYTNNPRNFSEDNNKTISFGMDYGFDDDMKLHSPAKHNFDFYDDSYSSSYNDLKNKSFHKKPFFGDNSDKFFKNNLEHPPFDDYYMQKNNDLQKKGDLEHIDNYKKNINFMPDTKNKFNDFYNDNLKNMYPSMDDYYMQEKNDLQKRGDLDHIDNYKKNIDFMSNTNNKFNNFYNNDLNKNFFEKDALNNFKNTVNTSNITDTTKANNVDKTNVDDSKKGRIYSPVVDFTSYFPESCQRDVDSFYIDKDKFFEADKNITNEDLKEIVRKHPYLESLDNNINDFTVLNKLENLKELSVNNCDYFTNLDDIDGCHNLRVLNVGNTFIKNLYALENFPNLEILNCACNSIVDLNGIENCPKITDIILWNCFSLKDISALVGLSKLRFLDIDSTSISDIFALSNCYNLEFLFMDNCNKIDDIFSLSVLEKLRCLLFDGKNILMPEQVMALKNLTNLECLTLSGRRVVDAEPFRKMTKMKELTLSGCNITDLSPLENLTEIRKLDLTANSNLRDLSPLANMKEITKLVAGGGGSVGGKVGSAKGAAISSMNISDISVVRNFTKLTEIDLNTNPRLRDITPLEVCKDMEEINLSKCMQLEDVSVLGKLSKITKLNLTSCPKIKDLYCLRNLAELLELQYNGTIVHTPGLISVLKKCKGIYLLKGNDADIVSQSMLVSGKKKAKLTKTFGKYFKTSK